VGPRPGYASSEIGSIGRRDDEPALFANDVRGFELDRTEGVADFAVQPGYASAWRLGLNLVYPCYRETGSRCPSFLTGIFGWSVMGRAERLPGEPAGPCLKRCRGERCVRPHGQYL
jgi:hypothetical protein